MKKILIADFFGTLIADDIEQSEYQCGYGDLLNRLDHMTDILNNKEYANEILNKMFILLDRNLRDYLEAGNILKIVTSDAGHCEGIEWFLKEVVPRFKSLKQYPKQIEIYFSDISSDANNYFLQNMQLFEDEQSIYFVYNCTRFNLINEKIDIFNIIQKQYNLSNIELFALGNDSDDLMMLIQCIELGGKSAIIKQNLYTASQYLEKSISDIIGDKIYTDYLIMIEDMILKENPNFSALNKYIDRSKIIRDFWKKVPFEEYADKQKAELYKLLKKGQLDIQEIINRYFVYEIMTSHSYENLKYKTFHENRGNELTLYPNFNTFKTKILKY